MESTDCPQKYKHTSVLLLKHTVQSQDSFVVDVAMYVLGDNNYPLLPWLIKLCSDNRQLTREIREFTIIISAHLMDGGK